MITLYLDTQDYSRIDDALAGRPRGHDANTAAALLKFKRDGKVRIAYSMMNLSELLQYHGGGYDLTLRKAYTVRRLCDGNAYLFLGRLLAHQFATTLASTGAVFADNTWPTPISEKDGWYPDICDAFAGFAARMKSMKSEKISEVARNRFQRRQLTKASKSIRYSKLSFDSTSDLARQYGFSQTNIRTAVTGYLDGKVSRVAANEILFGEMADPVNFVRWYFRQGNSDQSLPIWMNQAGTKMKDSIDHMREKMARYQDVPDAAKKFVALWDEQWPEVATQLATVFVDDIIKYGIDVATVKSATTDLSIISKVPFFTFLRSFLPDYTLSHSGLLKFSRSAKSSDGGDIFHALTLPYCDIWRSDSYFAGMFKRHAPPGSAQIVSNLDELPDVIARRLSSDQGSHR